MLAVILNNIPLMIKNDENKLDNPVWYSLSETHQTFSVCYNGVKFYHPDYCPLAGLKQLKIFQSIYLNTQN